MTNLVCQIFEVPLMLTKITMMNGNKPKKFVTLKAPHPTVLLIVRIPNLSTRV